MGPIDLPASEHHPGRADHKAPTNKDAAERDRRRKTGAEDEHFRCIARAESSRNELHPGVTGYMRDENNEHCEASEEVQPDIPLPRRLLHSHSVLDLSDSVFGRGFSSLQVERNVEPSQSRWLAVEALSACVTRSWQHR